MLNLVLNLIQYWFSISFCLWGEILKRVQDDRFNEFQMFLASIFQSVIVFYLMFGSWPIGDLWYYLVIEIC